MLYLINLGHGVKKHSLLASVLTSLADPKIIWSLHNESCDNVWLGANKTIINHHKKAKKKDCSLPADWADCKFWVEVQASASHLAMAPEGYYNQQLKHNYFEYYFE